MIYLLFILLWACTYSKGIETRPIGPVKYEIVVPKYVVSQATDELVGLVTLIDDIRTPQRWDRLEWLNLDTYTIQYVDSVDTEERIYRIYPAINHREFIGSLSDYEDEFLDRAFMLEEGRLRKL